MSKEAISAKQKLIDYLLKLQGEGKIYDRTLINKIERADLPMLKSIRDNFKKISGELEREKSPAEKVIFKKDELVKTLLDMQKKGMLKDPNIIAKVEAGNVNVIKEIKKKIEESQKAITAKKKVIDNLLKLQKEGKIKGTTAIAKAECVDPKLFEDIEYTMDKRKKEQEEKDKKE